MSIWPLKQKRRTRLDPARPAIQFLLAGRRTDPATGEPCRFDLRDVDADAMSWVGLEEFLAQTAPIGLWDVRWCGDGCLDAHEAHQLAEALSASLQHGQAASFVSDWMEPRPDFLPGERPHLLRVEWTEAIRDFLLVCDGFSIQFFR